MGMNGDYQSMAEACGEAPRRAPTFVPGVDFDPYDEDDVEAVKLAMDRDLADRNRALAEENARLRALLGEEDDGEW
ncbi:hypothetical protein ACFRAQ_34855 [Nocardia sp. NPDC056611]|uniref:hypothetical protein n=1 Tax=Nocardia sp. NPDC056611 TaxID=3345877 RepID=UPI003673545A